MSNRIILQSLITAAVLGVTVPAFAAPITRIPVLVQQALTAARHTTQSSPAAGYRDSFARFGVHSESVNRALPAR